MAEEASLCRALDASGEDVQVLVLYHTSHSTCSQKVRLVLHEKGVKFDEVRIDLGEERAAQAGLSRASIRTAWFPPSWTTAFRSSNRA